MTFYNKSRCALGMLSRAFFYMFFIHCRLLQIWQQHHHSLDPPQFVQVAFIRPLWHAFSVPKRRVWLFLPHTKLPWHSRYRPLSTPLMHGSFTAVESIWSISELLHWRSCSLPIHEVIFCGLKWPNGCVKCNYLKWLNSWI